jgi:hypothetical protein
MICCFTTSLLSASQVRLFTAIAGESAVNNEIFGISHAEKLPHALAWITALKGLCLASHEKTRRSLVDVGVQPAMFVSDVRDHTSYLETRKEHQYRFAGEYIETRECDEPVSSYC